MKRRIFLALLTTLPWLPRLPFFASLLDKQTDLRDGWMLKAGER